MATNQKFWSPSAATGVSVTPANTAFTNSAWVTVFTAGADCVLTDIVVTAIPVVDVAVNVDVGVSSNGGSTWTVIDTRLFFIRDITSSIASGRIHLSIPLDAIPNGDLVGVWMRKTGTDTTAWGYKLGYLKKPLSGTVDVTTRPGVALPDSAALFTLAGSTVVWGYGAETAILNTAPFPLAITGYCVPRAYNGQDYEIELRRNGIHFDTFRGKNATGGDLHYNPLPNPIGGIVGGDLVTARWRCSNNSTPIAGNFGLTYIQTN